MSIFKAYDIRGVYGTDLTEEIAESIGRAIVTYLKSKTLVVGRDIRTHSPSLADALISGMTRQGADVIDIGLCSTPMNYFANGTLGADGSVMVTASHNPGEWNGFKLCREQAIPLSGEKGIKEIEAIVADAAYDPPGRTGSRSSHDIRKKYYDKIRGFADITGKPKIAIDYANAMGIVEFEGLTDLFEITPLYDDLDGTFPNHEANPLKLDTLEPLQDAVRRSGATFGAAFDGDADRCGFVDNDGAVVTMDLITALIAGDILSRDKGTILYDLRSSRVVREHIEACGGTAVMCRVGHAFIKNQMRDCNAIFAGELAGHYYFRENFTAESSALALIMVANVIDKSGQPLSDIVAPLRKYHSTGEINSRVSDAASIIRTVKDRYRNGRQFELDGISTEYDDWWFNVRASNTEPLLRLILEANTPELMAEKREELLAIIRG